MTKPVELTNVRYEKEQAPAREFYFRISRVDTLTWVCTGVEMEGDKVLREFKVRKANTSAYVKGYLLDAILKAADGKFEPGE